MNAPVAWRWNPYSSTPVVDVPAAPRTAATSSSPSTSYTSPLAYAPAYRPSGVDTYQFSASGVVIIPRDLATEGKGYNERYGQKEGKAPDPRADVISLAQDVQDIDALVATLATQPIDIAAAENRVTASNDQLITFLTEVPASFTAEQQGVLEPLRLTALNAQGDNQAPAQLDYFSALEGMLTPEQRANLRQLERNQEDATMDLQGQLIGQRIVDARAGKLPSDPKDPLQGASSAELLSLAQADGRALISKRQLADIDRKLQDVYELALTPQNEAKLQPKRQELHAAQQQLDKDPENAQLQQRVKDLTSSLDNEVYGLFSPNDHAAVRGFEAHQRHLKGIASVLGEEAVIERNFYETRAVNAAGGDGTTPPALQKQQFQLSQHRFEYMGQTRSLRGAALKLAGAPDDEKLAAQFDQGMVDLMRTRSSLGIESTQFDHDLAVSNHDAWMKANPAATTSDPGAGEVQLVSSNPAQGTNGTTGVPLTLQAVNGSRVSLDQAQQQHRDLEEQLKPKEVGFWDRALEVAGGVLEVVGGVVVMAMAGWTGIGAGIGALMIADGALRTAHSVSDWANGTQTDAPLSSLMQNMGMDRGLANGIDAGINFVATLAAGGSGAVLMVLKGTTMIRKGAGVLGLLSIGDNAQAVTRSIITRETVQTFTVTGLQGAGLTPTQANYVNAFGGFAGTFGAATFARARAIPGKTHTQFVTYDPANPPAGVTVDLNSPTRFADYFTRGAKKSDREEMVDALVGPGATARDRKVADKSLRGKPLVVLREVDPQGSDSIVGIAQVRTNATGRFGRDDQGKRIAAHQSEVKLLHATDQEVRSQTIAAGTVGVETFLPKQHGVFFQTLDAADASFIAERGTRVDVKQRVRREAPALLAAVPEADRPYGTGDAIDPIATESSARTPKRQQKEQLKNQLQNLAEIPGNERHEWPVGSRDLRFAIDFERTPTTLGSERLGKTVHVLHEDSYLAAFNDKYNPVNWIMNRVRPKTPQVVHSFEGIVDRKTGVKAPDRVAVYFPADTLPDSIRAKVVKGAVDANTVLGERVAVNRQEHPYDYFDHKVEKLDTVVLVDADSVTVKDRKVIIDDPNAVTVLGAATIRPDFKGFSEKEAPAQYPWLPRRTYKGSTSYLGDVFADAKGAGSQVVVAAGYAARNIHGARHFDFLTQRNDGATALYERLGIQFDATLPKIAVPPNGKKDPVGYTPNTEKLTLPTQVYSARFSNDAAQVLMDAPAGTLKPNVQQLVDEAGGSVFALQTRLDHMDTAETYSYANTAPSTTIIIRYNADFDVGSPGKLRTWRENRVGTKRQVRDTELEPQGFEWVKATVKDGASGVNRVVNPFANAGFENTPVRQALRNLAYASQYGFAQLTTTSRGVMFNLAGMQLATGQVDIVVDDPRGNVPFNFHRDSWNVSVVFKLTGTILTTAVMTPNARAPYPLDPNNGLQPLGRGGPALTNPTGPKSVGVMFSGRALAYEANVGVQWFNVKVTENGPTLTMVSSAGMKFLQLAANGRFDSDGMQAPASFTILSPTLGHAFYVGEYGVIGRRPHVSLAGIVQTAATGGSRSKGIQSGNHWLLGSDGTSTGATGYFLTRNPAWGKDLLTEPKVIFGG